MHVNHMHVDHMHVEHMHVRHSCLCLRNSSLHIYVRFH